MLISILIFGLVIFIVGQTGFSKWIWNISQPIVSPLIIEIRNFRLNIIKSFDGFSRVSDIQEENKRLRSKINIMSSKMVMVNSLLEENKLLKNQLGVIKNNESDIVLASVILSDDNNYLDKLYIDVGLLEGVSIGDYAIFENVFLGKLIEVQESFSILQLLSDVDSVFPVKVESKNMLVNGILNGELSKDSLRVKNIEREHQIDIGANVFLYESNSNIGILSNFVIGSVVDVVSDDASVYSELKVLPSIDYARIKDLFIITR